ncbi:MAG: OmpA family protein, partial [Deltaproteobacteria bacterium]|nr:OmpA family protein [Nannocystaceae bacterium]
GWSFDPKPQVKIVEKKVEAGPAASPPPPLEGRIVGQVVDPAGLPIPEAKLLFPGAASNAILTDANGSFTSFRFPAGTISVQVEVNGQVAHEATAEVKDGEDTTLQIQLTTTPALPTGIVQGSVTDGSKGVPFTMKVSGQGVDEPFSSTEDGRIALELAAGDYRGTITAPGFKEKIITFTVPPKGEINISEVLERDAPAATPRVSAGKGVIRLKGGIKYNGNAVAASSHSLLDELAAFLNSHPEYELVEIGVHTDDRGAAQQRTDERADSVKGYLVAKGVTSSRLSTKGYGASKPVSVNLTEQGRAKNNRTVLSVKKKS